MGRRATLSLPGRGERQPRPQRGVVWGWRPAIAATLVLLVAGGLGVLRVWPPFAVVMSGSMAPTINTGDMVVLQRLRAPARIGDVVAVPVPDDARTRYGYPPVVIHRVFRIANGQIRTKGDARPVADPFTVPRTAVDAKVIADIPAGGRVLAFFHSGPGLVWLLFGGALLFGLPLLDRLRDARGREADATAGLREELATITNELARLQEEQERNREATDHMLAQIDRLAQVVAEALGQAPAQAVADAAAEVPGSDSPDGAGPFAETGDSNAPNGAGPFVRPSGCDATSRDAAGEPAARPTTSDATTGESHEAEPDVEPSANPRPAAGHEPAATAEPAAGTDPTAERVPTAKPGPGAAAESAPVQPAPPVASIALPADDPEPAGASIVAVDSAAADHIDAPVRRQVGAPAPAAGVLLLEHARPAAAARWDEPPPGDSLTRADWAAPPARRFQRPSRLVAASQASTAWPGRRTVGIPQP